MVAGAPIQVEARLSEEVERFFAGYRDAYNDAAPAAVARHIAVPSLLVQSEATVWSIAEARLQAMTELLAFYANSGFRRAHFATGQVLPQGADHAVADVAWTIERSEGRTAYEEVGVRQRMG